jgi:hypothetical protein
LYIGGFAAGLARLKVTAVRFFAKLSTVLFTGFSVARRSWRFSRIVALAMAALAGVVGGEGAFMPVTLAQDAGQAVAGSVTVDLVARAEAGDSWAQLNLGAALDHGLAGFEPDPAGAVFWYRRAAAAGLSKAQFNLAHCLATGSGTARDDVEALDWMLKAAAQGLPDAQFLAGVMIAEGRGMPPDPVRARAWLRRAAASGSSDAAVLLQGMRGVPVTD